MKTPAEYRQMEFVNLLIEFAKLFKPVTYVEIGVKRGFTLTRMAPYVKKAIGVDPAISGGNYGIGNVTALPVTSQQYAKELAAKQTAPFIDFLFIDGDHKCEAVLADVMAFMPFVKTGTGLIFLHDTHPVNKELTANGYCHDAWVAADTLHQVHFGPDLEVITLPGPWAGMSIIRKRGEHHLAWAYAGFGKEIEIVIKEGEPETNTRPYDATTEKEDEINDSGSQNHVPGKILCETEETPVASPDPLSDHSDDSQSAKVGGRRMRNR